jgi:putative SOS response-associated peptidase YedK
MCNDYANHIPYSEYLSAFNQIGIRIHPARGAIPNLEPRDDIWPTDPAPVIRPAAAGAELIELRWGLPPARPKAPPVINMRSEGRRFSRGRCLVPASWFYEFTGSRSPKSKWRFSRTDGTWMCLAGLWRPTDDGDRFTLLTTAPGPDVAPIHNRQVVILERSDWARWLDPGAEAEDLLRPSPAGTLTIEQVR